VNALAPTRRDEAWRYSDVDAVGSAWPAAAAVESIAVGPGETLHRSIVVGGEAVTVRNLAVDLAAGARADIRILVTGAPLGRVTVDVRLAQGAHFELGGAILGTDRQTLEIVTTIRHAEPNATSNQLVRTVVGGRATGSYLGKVAVARDAQKTDAAQSFKAMLLTRTATANAKPELEIYADDVKCAHGATVGELDAQALFYLGSRGIPPARAKALMLQAFVAGAFAGMDDTAERERLEGAAAAALEAML
jgi:Fe-S cluster assembly protein SufD